MIKYSVVIAICLLILPCITLAQSKYFTREGHIHFISETPVETIEANNYKVTSVIDFESGNMEFAVLIKAFEFKKALMEEHFNENYMESDLYPKATFKGHMVNNDSINITTDGEYNVEVEGDLSIHGKTKSVKIPGMIKVENANISAQSSFKLMVADYNIKIPTVVIENIAEEINVTVDIIYEKLVR